MIRHDGSKVTLILIGIGSELCGFHKTQKGQQTEKKKFEFTKSISSV